MVHSIIFFFILSSLQVVSAEVEVQVNPQTTKKGKKKSEKEAEGTQAPTRIRAESVLKSVYEQNGQALEVDPD